MQRLLGLSEAIIVGECTSYVGSGDTWCGVDIFHLLIVYLFHWNLINDICAFSSLFFFFTGSIGTSATIYLYYLDCGRFADFYSILI